MGRVGVPAEGQDRGVLEEEELVADAAVGALGHEALLELECRRGNPIRPSHDATIGPASGVDPLGTGVSVSIATTAA